MARTQDTDQPKREDALSKTRRKVQEAVERAEAEHRSQLMQKRIELAQAGVQAMRAGKPVEAVRSFHTYLRILEDWKGVKEGGLSSSHFDVKKEAAELLLISGVYWDLVRVYDKMRTPKKQREFLHYLEKFILFSKGMPFQALCAETLRKYIASSNPVHKEDFKNAYKLIATTKCFVVTALFDVVDPETPPKLWKFRDERLEKSASGRLLIATYYRVGPVLACVVEGLPFRARRVLARWIDRVALLISN